MASDAKTKLPCLGWSDSKWHLLRAMPKDIPKTHRYRVISHEEFRLLSKNLDVYRQYGKIIVVDALSTVILPRLTGIRTDQSGWREPSKYEHLAIPNDLAENDHVLVAYGTVDGMYVHISYAKSDSTRFRQMVVTGVIEPRNLQGPPVSKLMIVAENVANNHRRILEAKRLIESGDVDSDSKSHLQKLIEDFRSQSDAEIRSIAITPRLVDDTTTQIAEEVRILEEERKRREILLRIDDNLELSQESRRRSELGGNVEAIAGNIDQHMRTITNLKLLKEYLLT